MRKIIQAEFTRQAEQMDASAAFRAEDALRRVVKAVSPSLSDRILDLACGPGIVAEVLAPLAGEVAGVDATLEMIRLARRRFGRAGIENGVFEVSAAEHLPFRDGAFNAIVTRLTLHHFSDVAAVLQEARRVLHSSGRLIVADVISSEVPEKSALHNALEQLRDPSHFRMHTRSELLRSLEASGFSISSEETWQQRRNFSEWAQIVADTARTEPLLNVMRALAHAGLDAGISLREDSGELYFVHTWLMVQARVS